jgi:hypothetical protein
MALKIEGSFDYYIKKDKGFRKADNPDTSVESILPRGDTKTRFRGKFWGSPWDPGNILLNTGTTGCGTPE